MEYSGDKMINKKLLHVCCFSGGKDSTAMLLKMHELKLPLDVILFCDTGLEFPEVYQHISKVENNIGRKVTTVKAEKSFEYFMLRKDNALKDKAGWSWPNFRTRWCTGALKFEPVKKFFRNLKEVYDIIEYVGIAADETKRLKHKNNNRPTIRLPLVEWGMTEQDCLDYCYERGYNWGGLYKLFDRVSCWCCPLQSLNDLRALYKNFPDLWNKLKDWDSQTRKTFRADYSVEQLGKRFELEAEYLKAGAKINDKAFFNELRKRLNDGV